jgi:hypothetical protein
MEDKYYGIDEYLPGDLSNIVIRYAVEVVYEQEAIKTYLFGKLHSCFDEPAIVYKNGVKEWYWRGMRHRDGDKPAFIFKTVSSYWYYGLCHRTGDKPAVTSKHGFIQEWWLYGKKHRDDDKPAIIYDSGSVKLQVWWYRGDLHRGNDKPAFIKHFSYTSYPMNTNQPIKHNILYREWWFFGKLHRYGKPAVIKYSAITVQEWWVNGYRYSDGDYKKIIEDPSRMNLRIHTGSYKECFIIHRAPEYTLSL